MTFRVIDGGGAAPSSGQERVPPLSGLPGHIEAERLRIAVRALPAPGCRLTVGQAFEKLITLSEDEGGNAARERSRLQSALSELGIYALPAHKVTHDSLSELHMVRPDFLLKAHPELAGLHPVAHPQLKLA